MTPLMGAGAIDPSVVGNMSLAVTFGIVLLTIALSAYAILTRSPKLVTLSRHGIYVAFASVLVAATALAKAFFAHDFHLNYVAQYSDTSLPGFYLITAFWAGQAGSLLFWAVVLLAASALAVFLARDKDQQMMAWVHAILAIIAAFFVALLVFESSPFETNYLIQPPHEGHGLNPLLQNYWMVIHPPSLLIGYAIMAIPFAFGTAALITRRSGNEWIGLTRRWILVTFLFLSLGNLLGARWAYEELGWGGYWDWDPVENAGILPWFTLTALLHSVIVQQRRGMLKRWSAFLLILTFWLTLFGTFLTRSGMIQSVHSFAASGIGSWFLAALAVTGLFGAVLLYFRWSDLRSDHRLSSLLSRETVFLANNWIMLTAMFVTVWGTVFPKIRDLTTGQDSRLGAEWFNQFASIIGLTVLLLMGLGTLIAWRGATRRNLQRNFAVPLVATVVITVPLVIGYYAFRFRALQPSTSTYAATLAVLAVALCVFALSVTLYDFTRGLLARKKKTGAGLFSAAMTLIGKNRQRYGGYIVHIGIILVFFGVSGNAFKISQQVTLETGQSAALGDYVVTFQAIDTVEEENYLATVADLTLQTCARSDSGFDLGQCSEPVSIRPAVFDYFSGGAGPSRTNELAIRTTLLEDVYVAISGIQLSSNQMSFDMFVNPFVFWLWAGGIIIIAGVVICFWPEPQRVRRLAKRSYRPLFDRLGLVALVLAPLLVFTFGNSVAAQPEMPPSDVELVEAQRQDGTAEAELFGTIRCQCPGCAGATLTNCKPTCGTGRQDRERIRSLLAEGRTVDEIIAIFVEERGDAALAVPEDSPMTVWIIPIVAVGLGVVVVGLAMLALRRRGSARSSAKETRSPSSNDTEPHDDEGYRRRFEAELKELD